MFSFPGLDRLTEIFGYIKDRIESSESRVYYCTCSTAAGTATKVVTPDGNMNFSLRKGAIIVVKFTKSNTASSVKLNVNGTGAKSIYYNNAVYTGNSTVYTTYANRHYIYMYDGTYWVWMGASYDNNTTYTNAALGQGYGTCDTDPDTAEKAVTLSNYKLILGGVVAVKFDYAVSAGATVNIASAGAKPIFYKGAAITSGIIRAGDIATFIYDNTNYVLLTIDRAAEPSILVLPTFDVQSDGHLYGEGGSHIDFTLNDSGHLESEVY